MRPLLVLLALASVGCRPDLVLDYCSIDAELDATPAAEAPTYFEHIKPIVDGRCVTCHQVGGVGGFPLTNYAELFAARDAARAAIEARQMPPFLAHPCCQRYELDTSLSDEQIATFGAWMDAGALEGAAVDEGAPLPAVGGLERVDFVATMREPYEARPIQGRTDDFRCFVLDWPFDEDVVITGFEPRPSNREILHHLIVAAVSGEALAEVEAKDRDDPAPGFECADGVGGSLVTEIIGGSLVGGTFPHDVGRVITRGSKLFLNVHYSVAGDGDRSDQTSIAFQFGEANFRARTIPIANPVWLVGDGQRIPAGNPDVRFQLDHDPRLITRSRRVEVIGANVHMHEFGRSAQVGILRANGSTECMLEIGAWDFGWEQPYWLRDPVVLEPGDRVYVECHFDNSESNQPIVDGQRQAPRDVAWGPDNQDMCAGFLSFKEAL